MFKFIGELFLVLFLDFYSWVFNDYDEPTNKGKVKYVEPGGCSRHPDESGYKIIGVEIHREEGNNDSERKLLLEKF